MSEFETSNSQMDDLLDAITNALLAEQHDIDYIIEQYDVRPAGFDGLVDLVRKLQVTLIGQQPSDEFTRRLKQELIGQQYGLLGRVRYMPGRVQVAAGLALGAGFMFILRRRLTGDDSQDSADIPVLQQ